METKKKIITIAGKLGSGKSSAAKKIAAMLNLEHFSSGDFYRKLGVERGLDIKEITELAETEPEIDELVDKTIRDKGKEEKIIIDSRLAFHWIPESFKVYLDIDSDVAAERMFFDLETNESRQESEHTTNLENMKKNMIERHECEVRRYQNLYQVNHTDHTNFDLVIDTGKTENDLNEVVKQVVQGYIEHCKKIS
jgi:cytidylate kinase